LVGRVIFSKTTRTGIAPAWTVAPSRMELDGGNVSFDVPSGRHQRAGELVYVSPGQINVQVPWELQGQTSARSGDIDEMFGYPLFRQRVRCAGRLRFRRSCGERQVAARMPSPGAQILQAPGPPWRDSVALCQWPGSVTNPAPRVQPGSPIRCLKPRCTAGGDDRRAAGPVSSSAAGAGYPALVPDQRERCHWALPATSRSPSPSRADVAAAILPVR